MSDDSLQNDVEAEVVEPEDTEVTDSKGLEKRSFALTPCGDPR